MLKTLIILTIIAATCATSLGNYTQQFNQIINANAQISTISTTTATFVQHYHINKFGHTSLDIAKLTHNSIINSQYYYATVAAILTCIKNNSTDLATTHGYLLTVFDDHYIFLQHVCPGCQLKPIRTFDVLFINGQTAEIRKQISAIDFHQAIGVLVCLLLIMPILWRAY